MLFYKFGLKSALPIPRCSAYLSSGRRDRDIAIGEEWAAADRIGGQAGPRNAVDELLHAAAAQPTEGWSLTVVDDS